VGLGDDGNRDGGFSTPSEGEKKKGKGIRGPKTVLTALFVEKFPPPTATEQPNRRGEGVFSKKRWVAGKERNHGGVSAKKKMWEGRRLKNH